MNASAQPPIQAYLEQVHRSFAALDGGAVATYIPELAKADPSWFAIAIATVNGHVYEVGASRQPFTIQSISKALTYGLALADRGREGVEAKIGVEPTGDAFNSISLEPGTGRPLNPMVNAGAIAVASLIDGRDEADKLRRIVDTISAFAGRPLAVDESVFRSERDTGHRNRAIGHMLRSNGILDDDPETVLDLYFRQCSVLVDCRDLALIAATLANGGTHPLTHTRVVDAEHVQCILSVMTTCGMYDFAGGWVHRVGLPAKSGVAGGLIAVLPGQLGIGVFSPLLDARGNSVRGVAVCERLSSELGLHFLQPPRPSASTVRARYTLAAVRSKRRRPPEEQRLLEEKGARVLVLELQGDLRFATVEPVLREIVEAGDALEAAVLDFKRVSNADAGATQMLARLVATCGARGQALVLTRVRRDGLLDDLDTHLDQRYARAVVFQPQLDAGLEWCERRLLGPTATSPVVATGAAGAATLAAGLGAHRLCAGAGEDELAQLQARLALKTWDSGATIVRRGDPADAIYFLLRGQVSVIVDLPGGGVKRLATLSAGMGFGESALTAGGRRGADVRADTEVRCAVLSVGAFRVLQRECPSLAITLLHNLLQTVNETTSRLTAEVAALEG